MSANNRYIASPESLVTTHEETRAGFLAVALEKNRLGDPFAKNALAFKAIVSGTRAPEDLLSIPQVRPFLATAAGLSDKSLSYLDEEDQDMAISELADKFLKPAGESYVDEAAFRYLLIKGGLAYSQQLTAISVWGKGKQISAAQEEMGNRKRRNAFCYRFCKLITASCGLGQGAFRRMEQLALFEEPGIAEGIGGKSSYMVDSFSAGGFCQDSARRNIEEKYAPLIEVSDKFNRKSVSYQLSKSDSLHSWLRYKEGFSADLVNTLLDDMKIVPGDTVMDPFMGSGTTALVCQMRGVNSIGYDIMPICGIAIAAKANAMKYDLPEIEGMAAEFARLEMPEGYSRRTPYIKITESAYPDFNERFIQFATEWNDAGGHSPEAKSLFTLCMLNSLERCSYTLKTGQYLSWDSRSKKVIDANRERAAAGRRLLPEQHCRETIGNIKDAVTEELRRVLFDIRRIQASGRSDTHAAIQYRQASALFELPKLEAGIVDGVITSPPYCNRYDYTRTYALELVYLGLGEEAIRKMRQEMLSCTVESKPKINALREFYDSIGAGERFERVYSAVSSNEALQEVLDALAKRKDAGDLNNNGVLRMVQGYFTELGLIFAELSRVCKKGATAVFVNDNVRYGGEVVPVDCISTSLAEQFGFVPKKIWCLRQQKGNSSQQMKRYGRVPLRKSVTVWKKG